MTFAEAFPFIAGFAGGVAVTGAWAFVALAKTERQGRKAINDAFARHRETLDAWAKGNRLMLAFLASTPGAREEMEQEIARRREEEKPS